jgi:amino acid adenylation domain-containing protein/thioester reductase-like protein
VVGLTLNAISIALGPAQTWPDDRTVVEMFEAQAVAAPARPAVTYGSVTLSYGDLDAKANVLARDFQGRGVGPGDIVALVLDSGIELVVAVLASMKLAAPFVIVDTAATDRRATMLAELAPRTVIDADLTLAEIQSLDAPSVSRRAGLADVAYGYFTSGSTGTPKCALNRHRGLRNRLLHMNTCLGVDARDVVVQTTPAIYDSFLWQALWPLINGNHFVVPTHLRSYELREIVLTMIASRATVADFVPSVLGLVIELLAAEPQLADGLKRLRALLVGGEPFNPHHFSALQQLLPAAQLINTYGATENSIGTIFHHITARDIGGEVPIGRPITNTCAVILDDALTPVPRGTVGEIYVGGDCLGVGYLHDPERTEAVFIASPVDWLPTDRLYRTGDLGYMRADGRLVYVGRRDDQVQVHGVRIELGEVEAALLAQPGVRQAKVITCDEGDNRYLHAFVCAPKLTGAQVRRRLAGQLPRAMVPRWVTVLEEMPRRESGKVDGDELARRSASAAADIAPRARDDPVVAVIRSVWRHVLGADPRSDDSSFFDAGGDSLSAQRMALALEQQLGRRVSGRDVIESPTLAALATRIAGCPLDAADPRDRVSQARTAPPPPELAQDICWDGPARAGFNGDVLLTGGTGFIGAHVLASLLTATTGSVHCLVRAPSASAGHARLRHTLRHYRLEQAVASDRVIVHPADLNQPGLGCPDRDYRRLAGTVDAVVHAAAEVNLVLDYRWHHETNVAGTEQILRFATRERLKRLHLVSTLSVLRAPSVPEGRLLELPYEAGDAELTSGYAASKWMAERLGVLAAQRGLPVTTYRLGEVFPSSRTGVPNRRALINLILQHSLRLGMWFTSGIVTDYTTVDDVGDLMAAGVVGEATGWYHVLQPQPVALDDIAAYFAAEFGLRPCSYREFWTAARDAADDSASADLLRMLSALPAPAGDVSEDDPCSPLAGMSADGTARFSSRRAHALLTSLGRHWHSPDAETISRYARAFQ